VSEHETTSHNLLKEKLTEYTAITPLCRSSLLVELMNEMTELKQELDDRLGKVLFLNVYLTVVYFAVMITKKVNFTKISKLVIRLFYDDNDY